MLLDIGRADGSRGVVFIVLRGLRHARRERPAVSEADGSDGWQAVTRSMTRKRNEPNMQVSSVGRKIFLMLVKILAC